jgi:hypothetical protein
MMPFLTLNYHNMTISWSWKKIVLWAYLALSVLFFLWYVWNYVIMGVAYNTGVNVGIENTVAGIIDQASPDKCKPVPLNL